MVKPILNRIRLTDVHKDRRCELSLRSDELDTTELFKGLCFLNLPTGLMWVLETNLPYHQRFIFRVPHIPVLKSTANVIANVMELPLEIELTQTYTTPRPLMILPFQTFDPDHHRFREFTFTRGVHRHKS